MIRSVSKQQTADGLIEVMRLTGEDAKKVRNVLDFKEEKNLPHLEVTTHNHEIILMTNCKEP